MVITRDRKTGRFCKRGNDFLQYPKAALRGILSVYNSEHANFWLNHDSNWEKAFGKPWVSGRINLVENAFVIMSLEALCND